MCSDKGGRRPARGGVTLHAIRSKCTHVESRLTMARSAICRNFEMPRLMTLTANQLTMLTRQWECTPIVIKDAVLPAGGHVTGSAIRPQFPIVAVILGMTCKTIFGCSFKNIVLMTGKTAHARMPAHEWKGGGSVIKFRG